MSKTLRVYQNGTPVITLKDPGDEILERASYFGRGDVHFWDFEHQGTFYSLKVAEIVRIEISSESLQAHLAAQAAAELTVNGDDTALDGGNF